MNSYTSDTIDFFFLVFTSGAIAVTALAIASVIAFTLAIVIFRERPVAIPAHKPATAPTTEPHPAIAAGAMAG